MIVQFLGGPNQPAGAFWRMRDQGTEWTRRTGAVTAVRHVQGSGKNRETLQFRTWKRTRQPWEISLWRTCIECKFCLTRFFAHPVCFRRPGQKRHRWTTLEANSFSAMLNSNLALFINSHNVFTWHGSLLLVLFYGITFREFTAKKANGNAADR